MTYQPVRYRIESFYVMYAVHYKSLQRYPCFFCRGDVVWELEKQKDSCLEAVLMRKKSHISLARYIVNNMEDNDLKKHKLSFYIGSVLPDIKPSFVYKRHEMDGTYPDISRHIERLSEGMKLVEKKKGRK